MTKKEELWSLRFDALNNIGHTVNKTIRYLNSDINTMDADSVQIKDALTAIFNIIERETMDEILLDRKYIFEEE